ncbi:MAG: hypothetical protein EKK54_09365 [Neisseriaceae bacterium]|nr:MAG: hypothetical protein EKK54_09365 [Neisseriaceae bacterium]
MNIELNNNLKGKCLIATPSIRDDVFGQSVIYITEHSTVSGAVGVIINKNLPDEKRKLSNLDFNQYKNQWGKIPLYFGGPVELETGFVLHESTDDEFGWVLTGSRQKIQQMAQEDTIKPVMLTAGYCMWDSFQLEREVRLNNWLVIDSPASRILATVTPQKRYQLALSLAGIDNVAYYDFNGGGNA